MGKKYENFKIQEVGEDGHGNCEPIYSDEHRKSFKNVFWTVYGCIAGQGVSALADCATIEQAEKIKSALDLALATLCVCEDRISILEEEKEHVVDIDDLQTQIDHYTHIQKKAESVLEC